MTINQLPLWKRRVLFTQMVYEKLLPKMRDGGVLPAVDSWKRNPNEYGTAGTRSFHTMGLAVDINLYDQEGHYLSSGVEHTPFGEYWESIGGTWGGRFPSPDPNHYSLGE